MSTKSWQPWLQVLVGILIGLLLSAGIYIIAVQPKGEPVILKPLPTAQPIVIHVDGSVKNPGIYPLARNSRVADAIQAAGGLLDTADTNSINLAAPLKDGDKVSILSKAEVGSQQNKKTNSSPLATPGPLVSVNLNTASQADLMTLPGIGVEKANAIIQYRQAHGPFKTVDSIQDVTGIGPGIFVKIKDQITIDPIQ